jgi:hypothetical protein
LEGDELRVCYDTQTEFPFGLTWVKAKTLSGIGSGSWVRSSNWVKAFCLVQVGRLGQVCRVRVARLSGLAELSSDQAKTSPWAGFSHVPKPGSG